MSNVLSPEMLRFVRATTPDPDDTLAEMHEHAEESGFPHVGPEVGATLRLLARLADAERVFEFGSGFGYSAYWFAGALPADGEVVLTEVDADELAMAEEYLAAGGFADRAQFELGDAMETIERYNGPFDAVLIDHQKHRYRDAFEAVREKVPPGGVIVADNAVTAGPIDTEQLLAHFEGRETGELNESTAGIADYLDAVRADETFETVVLPLGEGIAVSYSNR
jgi:predicted O-methyltransferase YrrM